MQTELRRRISNDLNIVKFQNETEKDFHQRLIYSAAAAWVNTLILGNALRDIREHETERYADILYVQSHLSNVIDAYLQCFPVNIDWILEEDNSPKVANNIARTVIRDMIYTLGIGKIENRRLCHVSERMIQYGNWVQVRGHVELAKQFQTVGVAQWCKMKEGLKVEQDVKIVLAKGEEYYDKMDKTFPWKNIELRENYELFEVGHSRGYSKCWKTFKETNLKKGIYLLRTQSQFDSGYMIIKKSKEHIVGVSLDPWYFDSRELYRIMYALDFHNGTPAQFRARIFEDYIILYYASALPVYEDRIIRSFSWPYRNYSDQYARIIPKEFWPLAEKLIRDLGTDIIY